jgi:hypothetical protein
VQRDDRAENNDYPHKWFRKAFSSLWFHKKIARFAVMSGLTGSEIVVLQYGIKNKEGGSVNASPDP